MTANVSGFPVPGPTNKVDVVFLIDNTGSYTDDWPNIQSQMPGIVTKLSTQFADIRYGLALFRDFPYGGAGSTGDIVYQVLLPLTNNSATFLSAINTMQAPGGGADLPEAQYEAVYQALFGLGRDLNNNTVKGDIPGEIAPSSLGWVATRQRVLYLMTDADFHDSDTEVYPAGTALESIGRNATRAAVASLGNNLTLFTLVSEHPGTYITQGEDGSQPNLPQSGLHLHASELTDPGHGGLLAVGPNSSDLTDAIDVSIRAIANRPILPGASTAGLLVASLALLGLGVMMMRRRLAKSS
jgi:hypothetical protein